jgi:hypothetical protein
MSQKRWSKKGKGNRRFAQQKMMTQMNELNGNGLGEYNGIAKWDGKIGSKALNFR